MTTQADSPRPDPAPDLQPESRRTREVLRARAAAIARPTAIPVPGNTMSIVEFRLAQERYGIEQSCIREVFPLHTLTPVPSAPPFVRGVVAVRGQVLPVIDIKKFFDLPDAGITDLHMVIVIHNSEMEVGILADAVLGSREIPLPDIQPSLPTLTGIRAQYLKGVATGNVVILDAAKLLADPKMIICDESDSQL